MNLRYITCAGLYGNAPYDLLLNLAQVSPRVEIAVNVSPCETSGVSYHAKWLNGLLNLSDTLPAPMNIALHVNDGWCMDLCNGVVPRELGRWLERNHSGTNTPLIQRIQMNISGSAIFLSSNMPARAQRAISAISAQEVILPCGDAPSTRAFIRNLDRAGARFSVLYDVAPANAPMLENHRAGYACAAAPETIKNNLNEISEQLPPYSSTWIDASHGRVPGFDARRTRDCVARIVAWCSANQK